MMLLHISTFGTHRSHGLRENMFTDRQTDTHTHTHTQTDYNNPPAHARGLMNAEPSASTRARIYNARARMLERHVRLILKVGSVHCWKRYSFDRSSTCACTPSCSNRWCFAVHRTGIPDRRVG